MNQIDGVCQTIEKTINQAVQKTLDQLEKDSDLICSTISSKLEKDRLARVAPLDLLVKIMIFTLEYLISMFGGEESHQILATAKTCDLTPNFLCVHAGLTWFTTRVSGFIHSCVVLWVSSSLPSSS